jgi:hypothetical protein
VIRIEVTTEDDVLRMSAVFRRDDDLRDCDYEIWLVPHGLYPRSLESDAVLRRWRKDGQQGAGGTINVVHFAGGSPLVAGGGGSGASSSLPPYGPNPPGGNGGWVGPR